MTILLLLVGLGLIVLGADWLVEGSSSIARKAGVSEFVIGLTIVGFGTSCPELVVSLTGAFAGNADIAVGNVIGSNIIRGKERITARGIRYFWLAIGPYWLRKPTKTGILSLRRRQLNPVENVQDTPSVNLTPRTLYLSSCVERKKSYRMVTRCLKPETFW